MDTETAIEALVSKALSGDKQALEALVRSIQDDVFYLALRMLANPEGAREATQEILIKVITKLSSFRFQSRFKTWLYRLATNYLIDEKRMQDKTPSLTFADYQADLESDLQAPAELQLRPDYQVLLNELRVSCTIAMLLCLKPAQRMTYILGDILELDHSEASTILGITKVNFRKQLSRSRDKVVTFTEKSCSLISNRAMCSCETKLKGSLNRQRVRADNIFFATGSGASYQQLKSTLSETQQSLKTLKLQSAIPSYKSIDDLSLVFDQLISQGFAIDSKGHQLH